MEHASNFKFWTSVRPFYGAHNAAAFGGCLVRT
jgi:hypothetical protein